MDAKEREKKQKEKIKHFKKCFEYIGEKFRDWDYRFDDPWYKEIHNIKMIRKKRNYSLGKICKTFLLKKKVFICLIQERNLNTHMISQGSTISERRAVV